MKTIKKNYDVEMFDYEEKKNSKITKKIFYVK